MTTEQNNFNIATRKLEEFCHDAGLSVELATGVYPIAMTIRKGADPDQLSMLDSLSDVPDRNAYLRFKLVGGENKYEIAGDFIINESVLNKLKTLFKNVCAAYLQYFYLEITLTGAAADDGEGDD